MGGMSSEKWLEAQQGVLGSVLIDPAVVPVVLAQTDERDFSGVNLVVFQAIRSLFSDGQIVDAITIADKLGGTASAYLMQLMEITPTAAHVHAYIDICKKQAKVSRLQEIGSMMAVAADMDELQELLEQAVVANSAQRRIHSVTAVEAYRNFIARHISDSQPEYLSWPIPELTDRLYIQRGDFVLIGGKPSSGKTSFALQWAWHLAETYHVGFFSLETFEGKLTDRRMSSLSGIPMGNIKTNNFDQEHWDILHSLAEPYSQHRFEVIDQGISSVSELCAFSVARKFDVIFIDYVQLLDPGKLNRYEAVTNISLTLHRFSQSSGCCVVGLSQLKRGDDSKNVAPDMSSLRESGQLEQDADAVLILYSEDESKSDSKRILRCAKNKEGKRFKMRLNFDGQTQLFSKAVDFEKPQRGELDQLARNNRKRNDQAARAQAVKNTVAQFSKEIKQVVSREFDALEFQKQLGKNEQITFPVE